MTNKNIQYRLVGAEVLRDDQIEVSDIAVTGGVFSDDPIVPAIDLSGYYLLPGIIDLHGDAFERHLAPRPAAPFDIEIGLRSTEREFLANGVTTAYLAQSWSWEGGHRSPDYAEKLMAAVAAYRPQMSVDMRVQIRFEYYLIEDGPRLLSAADAYGVDYIVFNNHLDQGLEMATTRPQALSNWAAQNKRTIDEHLQLMRDAKATEAHVPDFIQELGNEFAKRGIQSGSHDDDRPEIRTLFQNAHAKICEFPTNVETAQHARSLGSPILMGAPNVVRGGSQAGNIAATDLIDLDLCDALVSDYYAPALASAAWRLVDDKRLPLAKAWAMISTNAADALSMADRGSITTGKRADAVIINKETRQIEGTLTNGQIAFATAGFAQNLLSTSQTIAVAAE
ncbi:MAG: alpha-D-ribose 1-methylphosphonate 5-triphosphate diphosphatase [Pseudomonadota bacterium]